MQRNKFVKRRLPKYRKNGIIVHTRDYLKTVYGKHKYAKDWNRAYVIPIYVVKKKKDGKNYFKWYFSYIDKLIEKIFKRVFEEMGKSARDMTIMKMRMFLRDYGIDLVDRKKQYKGGFEDWETGHQKMLKEQKKNDFDITNIIK